MTWTEKSLKNPAVVAVITAILLTLGFISIFRLPVQLMPDVEQPTMVVLTSWPGASPQEIESEISVPLEEVLQGVPGLTELVTFSPQNLSASQLTFAVGTDMDKALLEVIARLNRVPQLPADSEPPVVEMGGWGGNTNDSLVDYFIEYSGDHPDGVASQRRFIEDTIVPRLQAIDGVSNVTLGGQSATGDQLQVLFDPYRAANLGIDIARTTQQIGRSNDVSGGFINRGRRQYTLRFEGRYSPEQLESLILAWRDGSPIRLGDIAAVTVGPGRRDNFIYHNGESALRISLDKRPGANLLASLAEVRETVDDLNTGALAARQLSMEESFDPSVFIKRAIRLLGSNLALGIFLAIGALWWFLRKARATLLIGAAIPISLLTTFVVLGAAGRSVNVISLAGLAFAAGMVLDAAIVVLENIVRLREKGLDKHDASRKGAGQVWGALLASTATTVAIFIPIMFLEDVEGQLFADLAFTIAVGVTVSLFVAVTILPTAAERFLRSTKMPEGKRKLWDTITARLMQLTGTPRRRLAWVSGLMTVSILGSIALMPSLNYLPAMKRDIVDAWVFLPPGSSVDTADQEVAALVKERLAPHLAGEADPPVRNYYIWSWPGAIGMSVGVRAEREADIPAVTEMLRNDVFEGVPDIFVAIAQQNLFGGFSNSDSVEFNIHTQDLEALKTAAIAAMSEIQRVLPNAPIQPTPDPNIASPTLQFIPDDRRLAEVGWVRADLANVVRTLGQGIWLGEYFNGNNRLDVFFRAQEGAKPEDLAQLPIQTPLGGVVRLGELVEIRETLGPGAIIRADGRRVSSIQVNPPQNMALEELVTILQTEVQPAIEPLLPADGSISFGGSASNLADAVQTIGLNFLLALGLLFMIMAALFKSLRDAAIVLVTIPLATVGGVAAVRLLNLVSFQPLDLLGMIGFIILLGLVVNNAILLVVQTRAGEADGLSRQDAVRKALRLRLRPIFMSTTTSIFGMLPLLLVPGEGAAIYRGMAAAIVGGMGVSTLFTLVMLPSLLQTDFASLMRYLPVFSNKNKKQYEPAE